MKEIQHLRSKCVNNYISCKIKKSKNKKQNKTTKNNNSSIYMKDKNFVYAVCEVEKRKQKINKTTKTNKQHLPIQILCAREV